MRFSAIIAAVLSVAPAFSAVNVRLTSSPSSTAPVGTPVTFVAFASSSQPGPLDYQFSVSRGSGPFAVAIDYSPLKSFLWVDSTRDGSFTIQVIARNKATQETASAQMPFTVTPIAHGTTPVISATSNPLVALYSAPAAACSTGSSIYVIFGSGGNSKYQTDTRPCVTGQTANFYIAGMKANTQYFMHHIITTGSNVSSGPVLNFKTGTVSSPEPFPTTSVLVPPTAQAATNQSVVLIDNLLDGTIYYGPEAVDLDGNLIWYYDKFASKDLAGSFYLRPVDGGTIMLIADEPKSPTKLGQYWREIDLAGNTIRQTNAPRVSEQLQALGALGIEGFDHDAVRLPNGHTLILANQEKIYPAGTQGATAPIDILGYTIVDLDQNLQVAWWWTAYDHLDVNRAAVLGETCAPAQLGCPPVLLAPIAADWLHANSLNYNAVDGNLLLSMRHQDWVAKIDYRNGAGIGTVLWELGKDGSFTFNSTDPYPWQSHQHDVEYELGGNTVVSLYDNGNTRRMDFPDLPGDSRGMVLSLDETNMIATPLLLQDLSVISAAVGSAQRLTNGDYHFDSGFTDFGPNGYSLHTEYPGAGGAPAYELRVNSNSYRSYRMNSLYRLNAPAN